MVGTLFGKGGAISSKTIYFPDYPFGTHSGLTVPFTGEPGLYEAVAHLSSYTIRQILGTARFADLRAAAERAALPAASFVRSVLQAHIGERPAGAGIQATFKGGKGSPLHEWFPYLEGYSPAFVRSVLETYAPEARSVFDPFCGSGTTALVAAAMGKRGFYCEVNPVCRIVIRAKAMAQALPAEDRRRLAERLHGLADRLAAELDRAAPDPALDRAFGQSLGPRPFFPEDNYRDVLRLRTLLDRLAGEDPDFGLLASVAGLRSLVPSSLLVRRGDLRFRTGKELATGVRNFRAEVQASLHLIASDLIDLSTHDGAIELVCENARDVPKQLMAPPDAVVTSPPYLNGTNYFRNTKIELWFIRALRQKADLRWFRDQAITAGINDVTGRKTGACRALNASPRLEGVLEDLVEDAYDVRIPMMVASYFNEMAEVAAALRAITGEGAKLAIDLGDSCYGSVWVPTDRILAEIMEDAGFEAIDEVVLRERQSRDGRKLRQTLQVFEPRPASRRSPGPEGGRVPEGWASFRAALPHQRGEFAKRNWGHGWHSMCSYQGKLKPSIAHHLVEALMPARGGRLLDPFSGVGTIPFEARLAGHVAYGFDISPAAIAISRAKLSPVTEVEIAGELAALSGWLDRHGDGAVDLAALDAIRFNGPISSYFHPRTLAEILAARAYFAAHPADGGARALLLSALLHILHGNRPYALSRRSHPITPFSPTGEADYRPLLPRLAAKLGRLMAAAPAPSLPGGLCADQDATAEWPAEIDELDAIITSPPFFDSTRFYSANWMRLWFAGWEADDFKRLPASFVDERQKRSLEIYDDIFRQCRKRLKPGGYLALHLGKSVKCDMAGGLAAIASRHLALLDVLDESVAHCESHGIRDKGTVTHHQYLLLRKD